MFPFFCYTNSHRTIILPSFIIFFFSLLLLLPIYPATNLPDSLTKLTPFDVPNTTWHGFTRFLDAGKGSRHEGMAELKQYFRRFGYLTSPPGNNIFTDIFDGEFESALIRYQKNLGLPETGKLDSKTMTLIVAPRCGVSDHPTDSTAGPTVKITRRFAYFYGQPRWVRSRSPMKLTYAFSSLTVVDYLSQSDVKSAFRRAFSRWSAVIPVNFTESKDYSSSDIKIGWYGGDHGDGEPFDGVLGVLAHAFSPENGRFHLDAAERWGVDFDLEKSSVAVDLESVATHEIGHILGLAHSSVKDAIMYPSLSPRKKKVELRRDDVEGIQALYGSNPNYKYDSRLESDISSSWGVDLEIKRSCVVVVVVVISLLYYLGL